MLGKDDSHLIWKDLDSESVYDSRIFTLKRVQRESPSGESVSFVQVDAPDWVTVIPELPVSGGESEFLIVRQFRHGNQQVGMEFPAGTVDPGESPLETARRELLEETGYEASELVEIGVTSPNPAFMNNKTHTFMARGLRQVAKQHLDEYEILDVHRKSFSQLVNLIGYGEYASAITTQAWYFYLRNRGV